MYSIPMAPIHSYVVGTSNSAVIFIASNDAERRCGPESRWSILYYWAEILHLYEEVMNRREIVKLLTMVDKTLWIMYHFSGSSKYLASWNTLYDAQTSLMCFAEEGLIESTAFSMTKASSFLSTGGVLCMFLNSCSASFPIAAGSVRFKGVGCRRKVSNATRTLTAATYVKTRDCKAKPSPYT